MYKTFLPVVSKQSEPYYGLGLAHPAYTDLDLLGTRWFYVWGCNPNAKHPGQEYVPMCKPKLNTAMGRKYSGNMLVFNEPNVSIQDNLSPEQAAIEFAKVKDFYGDARFIVGNVSIFATDWLREFSKLTKIERVGVHCYHEAWITLSYIEKELDRLYKDLQMPIWVTEFNTRAHEKAFEQMLEIFASRSYIERIAPFTNRQAGEEWWHYPGADLVSKDGVLNAKGSIYASSTKRGRE